MYSEDKYYVYIYLDPRKSGQYKFGDLSFTHEPFYVGKGFGNRDNYHINAALGNHKPVNRHKHFRIKNILDNKLNPIIIRMDEKLLETDALSLEVKTIKSIGRFDLGEGPLLNMTNGGEGSSGFFHTEESKLKMSISTSKSQMGADNPFYGKKHSKDTIDNMKSKLSNLMSGKGNPFYGKKHTQETKNKISSSIRKEYKLINPNGDVFYINGIQEAVDRFDLHPRTLKRFFNAGKIPAPCWKNPCQSKLNTVNWQIFIVNHS